MTTLSSIARAGAFSLLCCSFNAAAEFTCDIDFAHGLVVNDDQLRVMDKSRTVIQINERNQLFIRGRYQPLTGEQQAWLSEYSDGLHYVVPQMIVLATEGVDLAVDTIDHVYQGLVGADHDSYVRLQSAMGRVRSRVKEKFRHASNHYFIGPGSLESVDEFVDTGIEAQLEGSISTSVGGILSAISGINANNAEVDSQRVQALTRHLEVVGGRLNKDMGPRAMSLKNKAHWYCNKLKSLDTTEEKLRQAIPALKPYDVITRTAG